MQPLKVAGIVSVIALSVQLSVALPSTKAAGWQDHQTSEDTTPSLPSALAEPTMQLLVPRLNKKFKKLWRGGKGSSSNPPPRQAASSSSSSKKSSTPPASSKAPSSKAPSTKASSRASSPARSSSSVDTVELAMKGYSASQVREQYRQQQREWEASQRRIQDWLADASNRHDDDDDD